MAKRNETEYMKEQVLQARLRSEELNNELLSYVDACVAAEMVSDSCSVINITIHSLVCIGVTVVERHSTDPKGVSWNH